MSTLLHAAPAIPLDEAGRYVAAAYIVFVVLLLIYVGIMAARLGTISKQIESLAELAERNRADADRAPGTVPPAGAATTPPEAGAGAEPAEPAASEEARA